MYLRGASAAGAAAASAWDTARVVLNLLFLVPVVTVADLAVGPLLGPWPAAAAPRQRAQRQHSCDSGPPTLQPFCPGQA